MICHVMWHPIIWKRKWHPTECPTLFPAQLVTLPLHSSPSAVPEDLGASHGLFEYSKPSSLNELLNQVFIPSILTNLFFLDHNYPTANESFATLFSLIAICLSLFSITDLLAEILLKRMATK